MIGVNLAESPDRVKAYVSEMRLTFPVVIDSTGEVARTWGVRATPTHFLIDRAGIVRAGGMGAKDWSTPAAHAVIHALLGASGAGLSTPPARPDRAASAPTVKTERR